MAKKKEPANLMPAEPKKSLSKISTEHLTLTFNNAVKKKINSRIRWGNGYNHVKY